MQLVTQAHIDRYLVDDRTERRLDAVSRPSDETLVCQQWLRQSAPKRYIHESLYGDVLEAGDALRILDVGGGLTAFTRELAARHNYVLADLLAHEGVDAAENMMRDVGKRFVHQSDWASLELHDYHLVIANDIFPNVDQRLEMFLNKVLPRTDRVRLSLTYYDEPRSYMTRRIDAEEVLVMLAWDHRQLLNVLAQFEERLLDADMHVFGKENKSVYQNGRQVLLVEIKGDHDRVMKSAAPIGQHIANAQNSVRT